MADRGGGQRNGGSNKILRKEKAAAKSSCGCGGDALQQRPEAELQAIAESLHSEDRRLARSRAQGGQGSPGG
jgi:hypothetical protein